VWSDPLHCFRPVIYNENRNSNVCAVSARCGARHPSLPGIARRRRASAAIACPGRGAARNEVERCTADPGPPETAAVPGLQRIIPLRFMLRCARDTRAQRNAFTIARVGCVAKQGCSRCLFSSCSALLSTAKSGDPRDATRADFAFSFRRLRADARRRVVWPAACFSPVIYGKIQGKTAPRGAPSHVAAAAADHYLTRCRRGRG
jgi:hypothetical protein